MYFFFVGEAYAEFMSDALKGRFKSLARFMTNFSNFKPDLKKIIIKKMLELIKLIDLLVNFRTCMIVQVAIEEHKLNVLHCLLIRVVIAEIQFGFDFGEVHWIFDDLMIVWYF